jgi:D-arabinose 1-dehydrogenase-like Zn-dependent alcohol dehydrogenase
MKAARIVKLNEPLQTQELQTPTPKGTQILVEIGRFFVCIGNSSDVKVVWNHRVCDTTYTNICQKKAT